MLSTILGFIFTAEFIVGLIAGAIIALVVNNNLSPKDKAAIQADLDAANIKIKELEAKVK